ncbi:MAG: lysophospholipid acyltransferase family protein [Patescibacteria group bacterium]|jgi:1-acyl-sn-glycerol-3-phosphate acyltransferase
MSSIKKWFYGRLSHIVLIVGWLWSIWIFRVRNKVEIIGRENLPHDTRVLYVANHLTLIDSFLIGIATLSWWEILFCPRRISWNTPDRKNFLTHKVWKHLFNLLKNIPVARKSGHHTIKAQIRLFVRALKTGNVVLFFEATRSRTGEVGPCVPGVAETIRLAQPNFVIPILLEGIQPIMPIAVGFSYRGISSGHRGTITIGKPINFSDLDMSDRHVRKVIGHRVRQAVVDLKTHR